MWEPLLRWLDPIEHRRRTEDRRKKREVAPEEHEDGDGDDFELVPPPPPKAHVVARVCRVCGYGDELDHRFCPRCLAETMVEKPKPRRPPK